MTDLRLSAWGHRIRGAIVVKAISCYPVVTVSDPDEASITRTARWSAGNMLRPEEWSGVGGNSAASAVAAQVWFG